MADTLDDVLKRAKSWPEKARDELRQLALSIDEELTRGNYHAAPAELAGISRGLADLRAGRLASFAKSKQLSENMAANKSGIFGFGFGRSEQYPRLHR